jgi:RimJ/RimL family protein N-acetyltransferase
MDSRTARLTLHAIDELEARRIRDRAPTSRDAWAADYPFEGDLAAVDGLLRATARDGEQRPFGYYLIRRRSDGLAIGGVGFKGRPDGGVAEIGYGLVPSARGQRYASEALGALVQIAAGLGVRTIRAETDRGNVASQRTLEQAGFRRVDSDAELHHFEAVIDRVATD